MNTALLLARFEVAAAGTGQLMEFVIVAMLSVHLLLVDLAMAGPLAALWLEWRWTSSGSDIRLGASRIILRWSAASLAVALVLGALLLAVFWNSGSYGSYFDAVSKIPRSRLWLGLGEIAFYYVCLAGYAVWLRRPAAGKPSAYFMRLLPVMAATDLMFHFPPLFAVISVLAGRPSQRASIDTVLGRGDYYSLLIDAEVLSRVVHIWLAAFAVAGVAMMLVSRRVNAGSAAEPDVFGEPSKIAMSGARWSLGATLLQIPAGLWLAMSMSDDARGAIFGGDLVATVLFGISLLLTLQLLHSLASVALGEATHENARKVVIVITAIVVAMVAVLYRANRHDTVGQSSAVSSATVKPTA